MLVNRQILLKSRPEGAPNANHFELVQRDLPTIIGGQMLRRTLWLSVDPYMRARMSTAKSYLPPANVGEPMPGGTVSQVVASNDPSFAAGDIVLGYDGWQEYAVGDGKGLRKIDPSKAPLSWHLGILGMPGLTAYVGLLDIGQPKAGETVVISSAAGAVGSIAGQIAKLHGCRVIGIAGTVDKCAYVMGDLGFDDCINYREEDLDSALKKACPKGIDVYFDNVGGAVLDAVLKRINTHARIPLVGLIAEYNDEKPRPGPNLNPILTNRATMRGMIIIDHWDRYPPFLRDMAQWIAADQIHYREDVVEGLENAPRAFLGLFEGDNFGKRVVKVGDPK
ncbi:MAG: NADP-dependent oxidoreductase [Acidobacteria bacterium]|nr:NADP-dependent oxidoreductase [Acidobacteriota bacterium]